ncbi:MAG: hypothetical protein MJ252_10640 [archaeon]|nr:hypothetical protein [archaeon]
MSTAPKRMHFYVTLMPYKIKIAVAHYPEETIGDIQFFLEETMKKFRVRNYRIGRMEKKNNSAIILTQYKIKEFLEENEEIVAYPAEYGLTKKEGDKVDIPNSISDLDNSFIGKKLRRKADEENMSRNPNFQQNKNLHSPNKNNMKNKKNISGSQSKPKNENEKPKKDSDDDSNSEEEEEENKEEEGSEDSKSKEEESEESGDKSQDLPLNSNKKKKSA